MCADAFEGLARFYDPLMEHVDYDRWVDITLRYAALLPAGFRHLDAGCGTGVLLRRLGEYGWDSTGVDLSHAMLREVRARQTPCPVAVADITALPFRQAFGLATCLFDTVNFLLAEDAVQGAFRAFHTALQDGGLLYFDYVTERLVLEHFAGQEWRENNGRFDTFWASDYDPNTGIAQTRIRVNTGTEHLLQERVYPDTFYLDALKSAGFTVLGVLDAETSRKPNKRSERIDVFAAKNPAKGQLNAFRKLEKTL